MTLGLASGRVELARAHDEWAAAFADEQTRLAAAFGAQAIAIEHVGSTAVPGIPAKPILDIAVGIRDFDEARACIAPMTGLGYDYRGEYGIPRRHYFVRGDPRTHRVHVLELASDEWQRMLLFRDLLRLVPRLAGAFARDKQRLATAHARDRDAYQREKGEAIDALLAQAQPVVTGRSGASVHLLIGPDGQPSLYLKSADAGHVAALEAEHERIGWLQHEAPVARIAGFDRSPGHAALLTHALPGISATRAPEADRAAVVEQLGRALRSMHSIPPADCPFDAGLTAVIAIARERTAAGLVDEADFDPERQGLRAHDLLARLERERPASETPVVTHGDACLANVICDGDRLSGFVDCDRVGLADAYRDLAVASRSIASHYGRGHVPRFFDAYGVREVDDRKLAYYRLVDEFF